MLKSTIKYTATTQSYESGDFTAEFTEAIELSGRMIFVEIYKDDILLFDSQTINSINFTLDANLLKSLMRIAEIELNGLYLLNDIVFSDIRIGVSPDLGKTVYFVSYGRFTVTENEQNLESRTTKITAYDGMLTAMKNYELVVTYTSQTTNYDFLEQIATELNLEIGDSIPTTGVMAIERVEETYNNQYTYRDVLDDFAEILGGCIIIKAGKIELLKPTKTNTTITEEQLATIKLLQEFKEVTRLVLSRSPQEDNVSESITDLAGELIEGEEIRIENNQLVEGYLVNGVSDRTPYLQPILNNLTTWGSYWSLELDSYGYVIYEPCDIITVNLTDNGNDIEVDCLWLGTDLNISQGLKESMKSEVPISAETDYTKSTNESIKELQTYLQVDKVNGDITSLASRTNTLEQDLLSQIISMQTQIQQNAEQIILSATQLQEIVDDALDSTNGRVDALETHLVLTAEGVKVVGNDSTSYTYYKDKEIGMVVDGQAQFKQTQYGTETHAIDIDGWMSMAVNSGNTYIIYKKG